MLIDKDLAPSVRSNTLALYRSDQERDKKCTISKAIEIGKSS